MPKMTDEEITKLVDPQALAEFDPKSFVEEMRGFMSEHSEVTEKVIVYVNEAMKNALLAEMTEEEKQNIKLVGLSELITYGNEETTE